MQYVLVYHVALFLRENVEQQWKREECWKTSGASLPAKTTVDLRCLSVHYTVNPMLHHDILYILMDLLFHPRI